jgi:hypothetical protein
MVLDAGDVLDNAFAVRRPSVNAEGEVRVRRYRQCPLPLCGYNASICRQMSSCSIGPASAWPQPSQRLANSIKLKTEFTGRFPSLISRGIWKVLLQSVQQGRPILLAHSAPKIVAN